VIPATAEPFDLLSSCCDGANLARSIQAGQPSLSESIRSWRTRAVWVAMSKATSWLTLLPSPPGGGTVPETEQDLFVVLRHSVLDARARNRSSQRDPSRKTSRFRKIPLLDALRSGRGSTNRRFERDVMNRQSEADKFRSSFC
jgi:hypothetical protein